MLFCKSFIEKKKESETQDFFILRLNNLKQSANEKKINFFVCNK